MPVHRRGHAVLADAVVDVASPRFSGVEHPEPLGQRVVRSGQVGRAPERLRHHRVDDLEHQLRRPARRDLRRRPRSSPCGTPPAPRRASSAARRPSPARTRPACAPRLADPLRPGRARRRAAPPVSPPPLEDRRRHLERRIRPAVDLAHLGDLLGAERRACAALVSCLVGAPKPIWVRQSIIAGHSLVFASTIARSMSSGSWPSQACTDQPAASKRLRWSVTSAAAPCRRSRCRCRPRRR